MNIKTSITAIAVGVSLFGAGCPLPFPTPQPSGETRARIPTKPAPTGVAPSNGFGKLPTLELAAHSSRSANGSIAPMAPPAPIQATDAATSMIARPLPMPPTPQKPTTVVYEASSDLPSWDAEDDVLRVKRSDATVSNLATLAQATGLPSSALGNAPVLQGLNFSWKDQEQYDWNYDATQRMVSFWKQTNSPSGELPKQDAPAYSDAEMVRVADDFLSRHGFGNVVRGSGVVEKPWGDAPVPETVTNPGMPCPVYSIMEKSVSNIAPPSAAVPAVDAVAPSFAPCWYAPQVTVMYDAVRNGMTVKDANGWPFRSVTVSVNMNDRSVMGGSIWLDQNVDASRYPMIDRAEALKRLRSGGRNPIWPWMENGGAITVRIKTVVLAWMRYDVWTNAGNETYYIPALAGSGEAEYAKDNIQPYYTIVPLVADDAFEPVKPPEPIPMRGEAAGGSAGTAPAGTGTVTPSIK